MCVTVYYLNVSGLQSDRHSNKKADMFWTACLCLHWWEVGRLIFLSGLPKLEIITSQLLQYPAASILDGVQFLLLTLHNLSCQKNYHFFFGQLGHDQFVL